MKSFHYINLGTKVFALTLAIAALILPIVAFFAKSILGVLIFFTIWIIFFIMTLYNCFGKKIEIDEYGIRYITLSEKYELVWTDVKEIGVSYLFAGYRGGAAVIYFSKQYGIGNHISTEMIGENLIMIRYRKSVIKEIIKYWSGEIYGYYDR